MQVVTFGVWAKKRGALINVFTDTVISSPVCKMVTVWLLHRIV